MRETNTIHPVIVTCLGVALLLMQTLAHAETNTIERIEWKKVPIRLELVVGRGTTDRIPQCGESRDTGVRPASATHAKRQRNGLSTGACTV